MLTVVMPAGSDRLTTVVRARRALGLPADGNDGLDSLVAVASEFICGHTRRQFGIETVRETFRASDLRDTILLEREPITGIASILFDGIALVAGEGYELDGSSLYRLTSSGRSRWSDAQLVVEYSAGYSLPNDDDDVPFTLPATVERAAVLLVGMFRFSGPRDPFVKSTSVDGVGSTSYWVPDASSGFLSAEIEILLRPYVRQAWNEG